MIDLMEYMKVQWADIHHSRNQEWKVLAILGGIVAGFFALPTNKPLHIFISFIGSLVCLLGIYISTEHWRIFKRKMWVISQCEKALEIEKSLGKDLPFGTKHFPVQGAIVLIFLLLFIGFCGLMFILICSLNFALLLKICATPIPIMVLLSGTFWTLWCWLRIQKDTKIMSLQNCEPGFPRFPIKAELDDLTECLKLMEQRPLKLIADALYKDESSWKEGKWSFKTDNNTIIDKKLLTNPRDLFQFSVANEQSHQEFHEHNEVVEIFISQSRMKIYYGQKDKEETTEVSKGILIVPPKIRHKAELNGLTFVFQCSIKGGTVNDDKKVAE